VGFNLNRLCYPFTPFCLEEEFYLGYSQSAYQVGPFSANQRYIRVEKLAQLYVKEIVQLHGIPLDVVSDRDQKFQAYFWQALQKAFGTKLNFSSSYHPETDRQTKRVNQILEDMLSACVLEFQGKWEDDLPLVEFSYNNSHQSTIRMAPCEALYGRKCRTLLCWSNFDEALLIGPKMIQENVETIKRIREHIRIARSQQKSYADKRRRPLEFQVGDKLFLKVSPTKGIKRFGYEAN